MGTSFGQDRRRKSVIAQWVIAEAVRNLIRGDEGVLGANEVSRR
jgi:hypothetical protein